MSKESEEDTKGQPSFQSEALRLIDPTKLPDFLRTAHELLAKAEVGIAAELDRGRLLAPPFDLEPEIVAGTLTTQTEV